MKGVKWYCLNCSIEFYVAIKGIDAKHCVRCVSCGGGDYLSSDSLVYVEVREPRYRVTIRGLSETEAERIAARHNKLFTTCAEVEVEEEAVE